VSKVDAAKEEAMQDVFFAAGDGDLDATEAAVAAAERIHTDTSAGLRQVWAASLHRFT